MSTTATTAAVSPATINQDASLFNQPTSSIKFQRCRTCGELLPITQFYHNRVYATGYNTQCKKCHSIDLKKYRANKKAKIAKMAKDGKTLKTETITVKTTQTVTLKDFSDADLTDEMIRRGFHGRLEKTDVYIL